MDGRNYTTYLCDNIVLMRNEIWVCELNNNRLPT